MIFVAAIRAHFYEMKFNECVNIFNIKMFHFYGQFFHFYGVGVFFLKCCMLAFSPMSNLQLIPCASQFYIQIWPIIYRNYGWTKFIERNNIKNNCNEKF